jgi:DegV family protein with EDD domain
MGLGLLVLHAVDLVSSGKTLDEVVAGVEDTKGRVRVFGVPDSLDFLRKGGRIGGASHLVGSLLSIKPVLDVRDGRVEVDSKQRTRSRAIRYMASKAVDAGPLERVALADGRAEDTAEVTALLQSVKSEHPLETAVLGPVVGSHTGPGTVGVCFIAARS